MVKADKQAKDPNQPVYHVTTQIERLASLTDNLQRAYDKLSERLLTVTTPDATPLSEPQPHPEVIVPLAAFIRDTNDRLLMLNEMLLELTDRIEL